MQALDIEIKILIDWFMQLNIVLAFFIADKMSFPKTLRMISHMVTIIHGHSALEVIQYIKTKCCLWILLSVPDLGISALRASFLTVISISVIRSNKLSCQPSWFRCLLKRKVSCVILIFYLTFPSSVLSNHSLMIPKCNRLTGCCVLFVSFQNCFNTILRARAIHPNP